METEKDPIEDPKYEDLLLREYDYLTKMYISNEDLGEKRVNIFLSLASAALATGAWERNRLDSHVQSEIHMKFKIKKWEKFYQACKVKSAQKWYRQMQRKVAMKML